MNYHKTRQDRMVKMSLRERKAFNKFVLIPHSGRLSHDWFVNYVDCGQEVSQLATRQV